MFPTMLLTSSTQQPPIGLTRARTLLFAATAKSNVRALVSPIGGCCVEDVNNIVGNISRGYWRTDPAEVTAIKQIRIAIFTHSNDEAGRCSAWHVHKYWTRAPKIQVQIVEVAPVGRRPVIAGIATKDRARLKTNHCFAALPVSSIRI